MSALGLCLAQRQGEVLAQDHGQPLRISLDSDQAEAEPVYRYICIGTAS
ncbi:hypothetical protein [Endozoicomonas sp. GU-1]|nr:hypothetical protein [Endozoicomonas sp. GU-1]WBA79538.1 hypothetical protein O2T12_14235 [Endozoicomonas sp. GU-1]